MPRAPNDVNVVSCPSTAVTKHTRVFCLGHLATHIDAKVALLRARGFAAAEPLYAQTESAEEIKSKLAAAPRALLFVGGAMMHTHAEMMADLLRWIPTGAPTLAVDIVHKPDFDATLAEGRKPPFTPDEVAAASAFAIEQIAVE